MKNSLVSLIGIMFVIFLSSDIYALQFSRHNTDSRTLNAIAATGEITPGDSEKLLEYLKTLPRKPRTAIYLSSPGGNLLEGLKLGYIFKERRIKTVVEGSPPNNVCASACALAFLGGHDSQGRPWRSSTTDSRLGYHQFQCGNGENCQNEQYTQYVVSAILKYGMDMGAPPKLFVEMFNRAPNEDLYWFSQSQLCSLGIKVWDMYNKRFLC